MYHATVMGTQGASVFRTTPNYKVLSNVKRRVEQEVRALRTPGPYIVDVYHGTTKIDSYLEG